MQKAQNKTSMSVRPSVQRMKRFTAFLMAALLGLTQIALGVASAQITDTEAPVVIHRQAESAGVAGELQTFLARVSDDFEVESVTLYYRQSAGGSFQEIPMRSLLDSIGEYMIAIETDVSEYPGLQYYIEATDTSGNSNSRGYPYAPIVLPLEIPEPSSEIAQAPVLVEAPLSTDRGGSSFGGSGLLMGLGALLLLGALAGGGGSSGDGGGGGTTPGDDTVTLTIVSDGPTGN